MITREQGLPMRQTSVRFTNSNIQGLTRDSLHALKVVEINLQIVCVVLQQQRRVPRRILVV